jgi:uncharacterized membrane protein (Fun14 family)
MTTVTDFAPFVGVGGGFVAGALVGYAVKKVIKFAAVIVGLFIAALAYLEYQRIISVDWVKFHILLTGPPASAKTMFLTSLLQHSKKLYFVDAGNATKAA